MKTRSTLRRGAARGFTLVELLTVIAIIGILAGIIVPTVGGIQRQVAKVRTKSMFTRFQQAYFAFKSEYGYLPRMGLSDGDKFELRDNNEVFIQTLSGRRKDGEAMDNEDARKANKRRRTFYTFEENDFAPEGTEFEDQIVDAFGNPNIVIVTDIDGNGVIPRDSLPDARDDINTQVAVFSEEDTTFDFPAVNSWE